MSKSNKTERNLLIDYLRALNIIYIICWIHLLYWLPSEINCKSWFLGGMIIVFFLMGASYTSSRKIKFKYYLILRLQRIYIPYFAYGIVISILTTIVVHNMGGEINAKIIIYILKYWINPFRLFNLQGLTPLLPFVALHLWFISTALLVAPFIPFAYKFTTNLKRYIILLSLMVIAVFAISIYNKSIYLLYLNHTLFYLTIVILGFKFNELQALRPLIKIFIALISMVAILLLHYFFAFGFDMQANKFPPNIIYLLFGFIWIAILFIFISMLNTVSKIRYLNIYLLWFSKYSYTAYLFHPLVYLLLYFLVKNNLDQLVQNKIVNYVVIPMFILLTVSLLNLIFGRIEKIVFFESILRKNDKVTTK